MKRKLIAMSRYSLLGACVALSSSQLSADTTDVKVSAGYVTQKIKNDLNVSLALSGTPLAAFDTTVTGKISTETNLRACQAALSFSHLTDSNWIFEIGANYGWLVHGGKASQTSSVVMSNPVLAALTSSFFPNVWDKAKKQGHLQDNFLNVGYAFELSNTVSLIPKLGLVYDTTKIDNPQRFYSSSAVLSSNPTKGNIKYTSFGPILRLEMPFSFDNFSMIPSVGYGRIHEKKESGGSWGPFRPYSSGKGWGNLFFGGVNLNYSFDDSWKLDFSYDYKYQKVKVKNNSVKSGLTTAYVVSGKGSGDIKTTKQAFTLGLSYTF
jgi:hypothetical protein